MGGECDELQGLSRRAIPPPSTLVPRVRVTRLGQDPPSEELRSPLSEVRGLGRPPHLRGRASAGDAKTTRLHFRGSVSLSPREGLGRAGFEGPAGIPGLSIPSRVRPSGPCGVQGVCCQDAMVMGGRSELRLAWS